MASHEARFTTGSTFRHVVVMTLTGSLGLTFMFLVDVATLFWVSQLGEEMLIAAVGFAWVIQFFTISAGIGLSIATTALVARAIGQGEWERARGEATGALAITFSIQAAVALVVLMLRDPILALLGAEGETARVASRFLLISVPSLPLMAFGMAGGAILRAAGDAWRAMLVTLSAGAVAILVDPFLILRGDMILGLHLPFTVGLGLGVDGAAWGMVLSRATTGIMGIWFVIRVHDLAAPLAYRHVKAISAAYFKIAGPAIATQLSTPFGNFLLTMIIAGYGDAAVAGWSWVSRLTVLAFGGVFALSGAVGGIIGQNYGAGALDRVRSTYRDSLAFCTVYTVVTWALLALATPFVVPFFGLTAAGAEVVRAFTLFAAGAFIFTGALFVATAAFNNLGRPLWSTGLSWFRDAVVILPCGWGLAQLMGAPGVVYGQALAGVIVGTLATVIGWRFVATLTKPRPAPRSTSAPAPAPAPARAE